MNINNEEINKEKSPRSGLRAPPRHLRSSQDKETRSTEYVRQPVRDFTGIWCLVLRYIVPGICLVSLIRFDSSRKFAASRRLWLAIVCRCGQKHSHVRHLTADNKFSDHPWQRYHHRRKNKDGLGINSNMKPSLHFRTEWNIHILYQGPFLSDIFCLNFQFLFRAIFLFIFIFSYYIFQTLECEGSKFFGTVKYPNF